VKHRRQSCQHSTLSLAAPDVAEPRRPGAASARCQRTSARGGWRSTAVSCRGQTLHPHPGPASGMPGNRPQAPAADAGDPGVRSRRHALMPNSGRCEFVCLCAGLYAINGGSDRHIQHCHSYRARLSEAGTSRRRPPGKGGPSSIARAETAQVLTVASGRSRTEAGRLPWAGGLAVAVGRGRLADEAWEEGASSSA
jgi:hypothetical protein